MLIVTAGVSVLAMRSLTDRYEDTVTRQELLDPSARRKTTDLSGPINYLLIGSDRRPGSSNPEQRADTILIAHLPPGLERAYLISIPRDLLVPIPAVPGQYDGGQDKINAAFQHGGNGEGGARLLSAAVTQLTGIRFDGAALIDFSGFKKVIDLLGGVRMCVEVPVRSIHTNHLFTPGCQQMDGARALDYIRQRYDLPQGDYDRQRHQQQLLRAMLDQASSTNLRSNPVKLDQVLRAWGDSLTVDTNGVPLDDLIFAVRDLRSQAMVGLQVPSYPETINQISYVLLDNGGGGIFESVRNNQASGWVQRNPRWVNRP